MSKIRLFAIVIVATMAVGCTIGSLPPQPKDGAADSIGSIDSHLGIDMGDTAAPHPDSNSAIAPDLGPNVPVDSGTSAGLDTGTSTGTGGAGGTDASFATEARVALTPPWEPAAQLGRMEARQQPILEFRWGMRQAPMHHRTCRLAGAAEPAERRSRLERQPAAAPLSRVE